MRDGWQAKTVGDVCELVNGGTPKTDVAEFWGGEHFWITPAEMGKRQSPYAATTARMLSDLGMQNSSATPLPPMSVILSSRAPIGHLVINTEPMAFNQGCKGLIPGRSIDHKFLFYYLGSIVQLLNDLGTGTTFKELSGGKLKEVPIPVPPLPEQKRIVAILDEAFAGIAAATANAEKNLANARELFDGHLKALFDEEQATWERKTLRQAALDFGRGKSKHRPRNDPKLYGGKYPFIQTGDVRNCDHAILESTQTYNESGLAQSKLWPKGTVCITIAANIAETGILGFDACFPDSVIGMVVDPKQTTNDFVEYLLRSVQAQLKAAGKGSAQDNINLATFEDRPFPFPELEEQARIVETLNELSSCVRQLEDLYDRKSSVLAELRQAILQKAFSGELTGEKSRHCEAA
ncbi:restriction endonuclease subunit S [Acidiphilium iwatense]|uniref:Restriction endonuclease subunit S n=1 Tax=Acidiphilium iwatense TaxID=768198 RepID=A0ABS9E174_9PROT|nr:restriction endonuclease subunit S [Acidiphilium iwatense]MCF3948688.1 restriction endonuclease subunit S [Acidiphilium iwatense]